MPIMNPLKKIGDRIKWYKKEISRLQTIKDGLQEFMVVQKRKKRVVKKKA